MTASRSVAQEWSITTADFQTHAAVLQSLSTDGVHVRIAGMAEGRIVPLSELVSLQRTAAESPTSAKFSLLLTSGDRLTGEPVKVLDEQLTWRSTSLGEINIPLSRLAMFTRGRDMSPPSESPKQDIVTLANGDTIAGIVFDCSTDKIMIRTDSGASEISLSTVVKVAFAAAASPAASNARAFRIILIDGSSVTASDVSIADNQLTMRLDTRPPRNVQTPDVKVARIEQLNGPISWLSSRIPAENVQIPYFGGSMVWPARMDAAVDGSALRFGNQQFKSGIGVHAYSRLSYAIDAGWTTFRTQYAIDSPPDMPRPLADVTVRIMLDGKVVREQVHVRGGLLSPIIIIDLNGAKTLTLEADYGDGGDVQDHLNWIEPALLRTKPLSPATAPAGVTPPLPADTP